MKKYLLLVLIIFAACASPKKLLKEGRYDEAIEKCIKKLTSDPTRNEYIHVLDQAFRFANEQDLNQIELLKMTGTPSNWEVVYNIYKKLDNRQISVQVITPLKLDGKDVSYPLTDYSPFLNEAAQKVADYNYNKGLNLLQQNNIFQSRDAFYCFQKAENFSPSRFSDINSLLAEAREKGISRVYIQLTNNSMMNINELNYLQQIVSHMENNHENSWVRFYYGADEKYNKFNYFINLYIESADVSPDYSDVKRYSQQKQIEDGFEYVKDAKGNIKKDSSGREIKKPKYKTIFCNVIENYQSKKATVYGRGEMIDNSVKILVHSESLTGVEVFEYKWAMVEGNFDALDGSTRSYVRSLPSGPSSYPSDFSMIEKGLADMRVHMRQFIDYNIKYVGGN